MNLELYIAIAVLIVVLMAILTLFIIREATHNMFKGVRDSLQIVKEEVKKKMNSYSLMSLIMELSLGIKLLIRSAL